ncbi:MAG: redoxin domain-containing protein [Flexibacteraceae bacterium]|jgi:peroxiredoxin
MNSLTIGSKAPDFTLTNSDKQAVTLSEHFGKPIVLLFFPLAFTSVCTAELCSVRDNITFYNQTNATVLGISVDSPFTLAKFKEEQKLNFQLLSDFNKEVSGAYGALYENFVLGLKGVSKRSAFVINAEGNIVYAEVLENAGDQPNFGAIQDALRAL